MVAYCPRQNPRSLRFCAKHPGHSGRCGTLVLVDRDGETVAKLEEWTAPPVASAGGDGEGATPRRRGARP